MKMKYDVFISYSRRDSLIVKRILKEMEERNISCFIDTRDINLSTDFAGIIVEGIKNSSLMLFIWSENSNLSENTANEIAVALEMQKPIVPYKIGTFESNYNLLYRIIRLNRIDTDVVSNDSIQLLVSGIKTILSKENKNTIAQNNIQNIEKVENTNEAEEYFQEGERLFFNRNFSDAIAFYNKASKLKHGRATWRLGELYWKDKSNDKEDALNLFLIAKELLENEAKQGNGKSAYALGNMYQIGKGVTCDKKIAEFWYKHAFKNLSKLAESKDAEAICLLGICYYYGYGVDCDRAISEAYFEKSADLGDILAKLHLHKKY